MKTTVKFLGLSIIFILVLMFQLTRISNDVHYKELIRSVNSAMVNTQRVIYDQRYPIASNDEYIAEFTQNLFRNTTSNDSEYKIIVYGVDYEKGLLDVEVKQSFLQIDGSTRTYSFRKTGIIENRENEGG